MKILTTIAVLLFICYEVSAFHLPLEEVRDVHKREGGLLSGPLIRRRRSVDELIRVKRDREYTTTTALEVEIDRPLTEAPPVTTTTPLADRSNGGGNGGNNGGNGGGNGGNNGGNEQTTPKPKSTKIYTFIFNLNKIPWDVYYGQ